MKVRMLPHLDDLKTGESGIHSVVRAYFKHAKQFGINFVDKKDDNFDIFAVHAGMANRYPKDAKTVVHLHGIYWSGDYAALSWEWEANESVIESTRRADLITVPSNWVAETIQRDLRVNPVVLNHGIDWQEWQHDYDNGNYVLAYAKNRVMDVCNPNFISELANKFPDKLFICTFAPKDAPGNVRITGLLPHEKMKEVIQKASVVISPVKETWGILQLESLASGTPVLGYAYGGNLDLIQHGVNGYLAQPGNVDDLANGLIYCLQNRNVLGKNANQLAKEFTWEKACEKLAEVYKSVLLPQPEGISVIIPSYMYSDKVGRAIQSVLNQTKKVKEIIVVDDGSPDDGATERVVSAFAEVKYRRQNNAGVAAARNTGISLSSGKYILCIDADDAIDTQFVEACLDGFEKDPLLGIAYTGLLAVEPNGKESVSPWPPQFNADEMIYYGGINHIPTCSMFKKEMWTRLGGYRSRYCVNGAGSEDAEFFLRGILHGYNARKVTDAPLFIYSYLSGRVSGNKQYKEIDWRGLHPSAKDHLHPFPCVATPIKRSHPVRAYDEPQVSVIIPVGPGHKNQVFNALDSLEAQTFRKWEAILIDDTGDNEPWSFDGVPDALRAYPYVKLIKTAGKMGAGFARNRGVEIARANLITFLDADDNLLVPEALEKMVIGWNETGNAIYTDYVSKAFVSKEEAARLQESKRLLDYNEQTGLAMHSSHAVDYDYERAVIQPANPLYIWNLITTLIPKKWHEEIGGFDEKLPSWEDWEYWLRIARSGKCFSRLAEPLVAYRFYTGERRETGIRMPQELSSYISEKLEGVEIMACKSCGGQKRVTVSVPINTSSKSETLTDNDMVLITYENPNRGMHKVVGTQTKIVYGYRQGGGAERFYVHKSDMTARPDWFRPYEQLIVRQEVPLPSQPVAIGNLDFLKTRPASESSGPGQISFKPADLQSLPGVTDKIAEELHKLGIKTWDDVVEFGEEGLVKIEGIGQKRASNIYVSARKFLGI
jgi:glycosyltransferase involved in cell wall biosynthesis